jgi:hypothetical protein
LLQKITTITAADDGSVAGQFEAFLQEFCTDRAQALNRNELLLRKPWTEDGKTYFRLKDLQDYLTRNKFTHYNLGQIISRLRSIQDKNLKTGKALDDEDRYMRYNIKGRTVRVWWVPAYQQQNSEFDIKELDSAPF